MSRNDKVNKTTIDVSTPNHTEDTVAIITSALSSSFSSMLSPKNFSLHTEDDQFVVHSCCEGRHLINCLVCSEKFFGESMDENEDENADVIMATVSSL